MHRVFSDLTNNWRVCLFCYIILLNHVEERLILTIVVNLCSPELFLSSSSPEFLSNVPQFNSRDAELSSGDQVLQLWFVFPSTVLLKVQPQCSSVEKRPSGGGEATRLYIREGTCPFKRPCCEP